MITGYPKAIISQDNSLNILNGLALAIRCLSRKLTA
jgi:hypothetical protein